MFFYKTGYHVSLRRHRSIERNSSFSHLVSTEFSEGTDYRCWRRKDFVEMGDVYVTHLNCTGSSSGNSIELPDDDPVQCGRVFCVICNELATEQR